MKDSSKLGCIFPTLPSSGEGEGHAVEKHKIWRRRILLMTRKIEGAVKKGRENMLNFAISKSSLNPDTTYLDETKK